jgi:SHS2 domain-containing protein
MENALSDDDRSSEPELFAGVRALDHTADVGFEAHADSREVLFHRAGRGMIALLRGDDRRRTGGRTGATVEDEAEAERRRPPYMTGEWRRIALEAKDIESLFVAWLRELLWLYETRRFAYEAVRFDALDDCSLVASVGGAPDTRQPAREIKGVTYHGLTVAPDQGGWRARVIFDV